MDEDLVSVGDKVTLRLSDNVEIKGVRVIHIPRGTGDLWYFEDAAGDMFGLNVCSTNFFMMLVDEKAGSNGDGAAH